MDVCDFFLKCNVVMSAIYGSCGVSYEKIEPQQIIRIIDSLDCQLGSSSNFNANERIQIHLDMVLT